MAFAPLYLGSLFDRLDVCINKIVRSVGRYIIAIYVVATFFQMFIWEGFGTLVSKPNEFDPVELV